MKKKNPPKYARMNSISSSEHWLFFLRYEFKKNWVWEKVNGFLARYNYSISCRSQGKKVQLSEKRSLFLLFSKRDQTIFWCSPFPDFSLSLAGTPGHPAISNYCPLNTTVLSCPCSSVAQQWSVALLQFPLGLLVLPEKQQRTSKYAVLCIMYN